MSGYKPKSLKALHFDTFEEQVKIRISSALPIAELRRLDLNPFQWDDAYVKFLLNIYSQLIDNLYFNVCFVDTKLLEPIIIYVNSENNKTFSNITHAVSRLFIRDILSTINPYYNDLCGQKKIEFVPPSVFTKTSTAFAIEERKKLSITLSAKLMRLYIVAEHAAYHYFEFRDNKNCDYKHLNFHVKPKVKRNIQFYNIISNVPQSKFSGFTEEHKTIRREDGEHAHGFSNDFNDIFVYETKEKEPTILEAESESSENDDDDSDCETSKV